MGGDDDILASSTLARRTDAFSPPRFSLIDHVQQPGQIDLTNKSHATSSGRSIGVVSVDMSCRRYVCSLQPIHHPRRAVQYFYCFCTCLVVLWLFRTGLKEKRNALLKMDGSVPLVRAFICTGVHPTRSALFCTPGQRVAGETEAGRAVVAVAIVAEISSLRNIVYNAIADADISIEANEIGQQQQQRW